MTVVALRPLGMGDFLTAVPALRALAAGFPREQVVVAAPRALWPLAALAGVELVNAEPFEPLGPALQGVSLMVDMHGAPPESTRVALATRPSRLIAFAHPDVPETSGMPAYDPGEDDTRRWCRLLAECGIEADPDDARLPAPELDVPRARGATVIHPGAGADAPAPADLLADLARAELEAGREVVVTGGPDEVGAANEIARRVHLPREAVLAGRTDLLALAALVARAGRVVTADAGVARLAAAFGTPVDDVPTAEPDLRAARAG